MKANLKKLKPYGVRLDDGLIHLSFTLPVPAGSAAMEAAKLYLKKLRLSDVVISAMEPIGTQFSYFAAHGHSSETIDFTRIPGAHPARETPHKQEEVVEDKPKPLSTEGGEAALVHKRRRRRGRRGGARHRKKFAPPSVKLGGY